MSSGIVITFVASIRISFLFKAEYYSIVWIDHTVFIHPITDRHLGYFHLLDIASSAAINIGIQVSESAFSAFGYIPRSGVAWSSGNSLFNFLRNHCCPRWPHRFTFPPVTHKRSDFSTSSPTHVVECFPPSAPHWLFEIQCVCFPLRTSCWTSSVPRAGQSHEASLSGRCRVRLFVFALITGVAALKSSILLFIFGLSLVFSVPYSLVSCLL